ncbi:murein transglycosylase [Brumimicrobium salinarum]|uniref:Murein transglycosylase n=1 Tax=Brumimicrobium salinarum TaxID=2058658 RepID=A0A2I0QZ92_9FLAO|nr:lytic transglycosylase domain-containing protein [Brumimicrobium salinarum]PKR79654.1 murein transglycosylase [Brumimicrobium salinarum]
MTKLLVFSLLFIFLTACTNSHSEKPPLVQENIKTSTPKNHFVLPKVPKQISFAGENIDFSDIDLKERMDNELVINNFWHSNTILMMKRANRWFPIIKKVFIEENVPLDLMYIAVIESGLQNVTSPRGAKGFWQFMKPTAKEYGLKVNQQVDERYHVEKSTRAACKYLKKAYERFGKWTLATASYNLGMYGVADNLERQKMSSFFDLSLNPETARYVFRVIAVKLVFENPKAYGFHIDSNALYPPYITKEILIDSNISNLYEWSKEQNISIKILRKLNPWIRGRDFRVNRKDTFFFKIPLNNEQLGLIEG